MRLRCQAGRAFFDARDEDAFLSGVCQAAVENGGYLACFAAIPEAQGAGAWRIVASTDGGEAGLHAWLASRGSGENPSPCAVAMRTGRPLVVESIEAATAPLMAGPRAGDGPRLVALPVRCDEQALGALLLGARETDAFGAGEMQVLSDLAEDVARGVLNLRARAQRERFELELRLKAQEYGTLLKHVPDFVVRYDASLRRTYVNPAWERASGLQAADVVGVPQDGVRNLSMPVVPAYAEKLKSVFATGKREIAEFRWVNAIGRELWLHYIIAPELDGQGRVTSVLAVGRDVTEQKRTEEALRALNGELRVAATAFEARQGILVTAPDTTVLRVNRAFSEITGYSPEEVVGRTPRVLKSGRQGEEFYRGLWRELAENGQWQGEIWNRRKNGEIYPEWLSITAVRDETGKVGNYVGTFIDISVRKAAEQEIERLAYYDPLTSLANRRLFQDRLRQALAASARGGRHGALLFIDLDNFKIINDTCGHEMGNQLLIEVARRLARSVREGDTVARLGGDEFVIMLDNLSEDRAEAAARAHAIGAKLMAILNDPHRLAGGELYCSPSIGVTLFAGTRHSTEELLKQADIAMYQAKSAGRNALRFFEPGMQAAMDARPAP